MTVKSPVRCAASMGHQSGASHTEREDDGLPGRAHVERLPDGTEHRAGAWIAN